MPLPTEAEALAILADSRSSEDITSSFLKNNFETCAPARGTGDPAT